MKRFVALARVSSREQEREGFSLEVQEDALKRYAAQAGGEIVKLFKIAETASKLFGFSGLGRNLRCNSQKPTWAARCRRTLSANSSA